MGSIFESGSLGAYRADLSSVVPLDRATERNLAIRFNQGERRAGDHIVLSCLTFVLSIALEYRRWGVPFEDIVQQGNLGLLRAAKKFNPDKECRLATYAAYWIRAEIREYVVRACRVALLGLSERERWIVRRRMMSEEPTTLQEICGLLGVSKERVRQLEERAKAKLRGALFEMREEAPFA